MLLCMNMTTEAKELMTYNEVAELFGVTRMTVYTWVRSSRLTAIYPSPGTVRFLRSDVEAFIEASRKKSRVTSTVTKRDTGNGKDEQ